MTLMCEKCIKYVGKWINYLRNGLKVWKMTKRFEKFPKYLGNGSYKWGTA